MIFYLNLTIIKIYLKLLMISEKIKSLIQSQDPHAGMDQLFFTNSEIFHASYDAIFKKQWVFLTHLSYFNQNDIFT